MSGQYSTALRNDNFLAAIEGLYSAGHYEQVIAQVDRGLDANPESLDLHYLRGLALVQLNRSKELWSHVEFLLQSAPEHASSQQLAALYYLSIDKLTKAEEHADEAVRISPECSVYHRLAASVAARMGRIHKAKTNAEAAVALDPSDAKNIHISVLLKGLTETDAWQAWRRIQELENALALDPNNPQLHESIGNIYLEELDRPREAEDRFREALRLDPRDRDRQRLLFKAVGKQRLIYRVISIPSRTFARLRLIANQVTKKKLSALFWLIVGFKFVAIGLIWLLAVTLVFWPAAKAYEWLLLEETRNGASAAEWHLRAKRLLTRWPFGLRFGIFGLLILAFWTLLCRLLFTNFKVSFFALSAFIGIHFLVTSLSVVLKRARSALSRRKARACIAQGVALG